jgi:CheY-like chemotaxis protein
LESAPADQPVAPMPKRLSRPGLSRSIVVVEDNPDAARTMVIALERAGYRVTRFADASSALAGLPDMEPHAVLLDIGLPGMNGYELAARLREKRHFRHTLFIGISGFKRRVVEESGDGFDQYFNKPVDLPALLTLLDTAQPGAAGATPSRRVLEEVPALRVLVIDDHKELGAAMAALLRSEGLEVRTALSGREALETAPDFRPQLTFCDLNLPDIQGPDVIRLLRSNFVARHTYAVVLTALSNEEIRDFNLDAKRMGIDEFMPKPLTPEAIRTLVAKVKRQKSI